MKKLVLIGSLLLIFVASAFGKTRERLNLDRRVISQLESVLIAGDQLHGALVKQSDEDVEISLRDLDVSIEKTEFVLRVLKPEQKLHFERLLGVLSEQVGVARESGHSDRRARMGDILNSLANFVRIYNVDQRFKIFFCGRDRLTWVQTAAFGKHPLLDDERAPASERTSRECAVRAP